MKKIAGGIIAAVAFLSVSSSSFASDHTTIPEPGSKGCVGQFTAVLAQASKNGIYDPGFNGIGGAARFSELTPQEVHQFIVEYCEG